MASQLVSLWRHWRTRLARIHSPEEGVDNITLGRLVSPLATRDGCVEYTWHACCTSARQRMELARRIHEATVTLWRSCGSRLLLAVCVGACASLWCASCGGSSNGAGTVARIPPAEEPPWTKEATLSPDAGINRDQREGERPSSEGTTSPESGNEAR